MHVSFGALALTGTTGRETAVDLEINGAPASEESKPLRAAGRVMRDRGNVGNAVSFTVYREHENVDKCQVYLTGHLRDVQSLGAQALKLKFGDRGKSGAMIIDPAVLAGVSGRQVGVRSVIRYSFAGGALTDTQ